MTTFWENGSSLKQNKYNIYYHKLDAEYFFFAVWKNRKKLSQKGENKIDYDISTPTSSHICESCYSFSYRNFHNYLFMNEFRFNRKVVLKMI